MPPPMVTTANAKSGHTFALPQKLSVSMQAPTVFTAPNSNSPPAPTKVPARSVVRDGSVRRRRLTTMITNTTAIAAIAITGDRDVKTPRRIPVAMPGRSLDANRTRLLSGCLFINPAIDRTQIGCRYATGRIRQTCRWTLTSWRSHSESPTFGAISRTCTPSWLPVGHKSGPDDVRESAEPRPDRPRDARFRPNMISAVPDVNNGAGARRTGAPILLGAEGGLGRDSLHLDYGLVSVRSLCDGSIAQGARSSVRRAHHVEGHAMCRHNRAARDVQPNVGSMRESSTDAVQCTGRGRRHPGYRRGRVYSRRRCPSAPRSDREAWPNGPSRDLRRHRTGRRDRADPESHRGSACRTGSGHRSW